MALMKKIRLVTDALTELRQAYLFADADDGQCARLCQGMESVQLGQGETLFHKLSLDQRQVSVKP